MNDRNIPDYNKRVAEFLRKAAAENPSRVNYAFNPPVSPTTRSTGSLTYETVEARMVDMVLLALDGKVPGLKDRVWPISLPSLIEEIIEEIEMRDEAILFLRALLEERK